MEVTLEKIELVKDRTGVTYKEAKEALEAADGNVVDAIVSIEDKTDGQTSSQKIGAKGNELIDKIKEVIQRGNAARIVISKDDEKLLNLPLNAGVIGAVVAPWGIILGVAASFGFNCKIEVIKEDGTVVDITDKAGNLYEQAKEKGTDLYEQAKEKGEDAVNMAREKGEEAVNMAKDAAEKFTGGKKDAAEEAEAVVDDAEEAVQDAEEAVEEAAEDMPEAVEDITSEIKDADL